MLLKMPAIYVQTLVHVRIIFDMNETTTIYTIGHSNILSSKLIDLLKQHDIHTLVDVRSSPYSQYSPQFNRENLENSLKEAGLEYKYAGDFLGGRPKDPSCYKNSQIPDGKADFLQLVDYPTVMTKDWFQKGIRRLLEINQEGRTAIMCSEENPAHCHRHHLIGKYLMQKGIQVWHIRGDGNMIKAEQIPDLSNEPPAQQLEMF
jgi:uncharacterized protein (DUF488 family)